MNRSRRNDEEVSEFSEDTMDRPIPQNDVSFYHKQKQKAKRLGVLFLLSNIFVLILTALPVLMKFPDIYVEELRKDWFGIDDLIRMAEPLIALILQLLIFLESAVFNHYSISEGFESEAIIVVTIFAFSASLYQLGAGYHAASNMFKHSVETLKDEFPQSQTEYPIIFDIYRWIRNTWEHLISHYMYAGGGIIISWVYAYSFKDFVFLNGIKDKTIRAIWIIASILYGIIVSLVSIQYQYGFYVTFGLIFVYGFLVLGRNLWKTGKAFVFGHILIYQYYIFSYVVALVVIVIYISLNGLTSRNEASNP